MIRRAANGSATADPDSKIRPFAACLHRQPASVTRSTAALNGPWPSVANEVSLEACFGALADAPIQSNLRDLKDLLGAESGRSARSENASHSFLRSGLKWARAEYVILYLNKWF